jgi:hypothetical protein
MKNSVGYNKVKVFNMTLQWGYQEVGDEALEIFLYLGGPYNYHEMDVWYWDYDEPMTPRENEFHFSLPLNVSGEIEKPEAPAPFLL